MLDGSTVSSARFEPQALLLAEHAHAREICALAIALAAHDVTDLPWIKATAARLVEYFQGELPVHQHDEEELIAKALVSHDRTLAATIGLLVAQHAMLRDAGAVVLAAWSELEVRPEVLAEIRVELATRTARLIDMTECHLELEEALVFPRLAELDPEEKRDICAKLHVRRV